MSEQPQVLAAAKSDTQSAPTKKKPLSKHVILGGQNSPLSHEYYTGFERYEFTFQSCHHFTCFHMALYCEDYKCAREILEEKDWYSAFQNREQTTGGASAEVRYLTDVVKIAIRVKFLRDGEKELRDQLLATKGKELVAVGEYEGKEILTSGLSVGATRSALKQGDDLLGANFIGRLLEQFRDKELNEGTEDGQVPPVPEEDEIHGSFAEGDAIDRYIEWQDDRPQLVRKQS